MDYKDIVIKVITGQATSEEIRILKEWIEQSDLNKLYFDELNHTWNMSSIFHKSDRFDTEKAWQNALHENQRQKPALAGRRFHFTQILRIAAVIFLAFILGGLISYMGLKKAVGPPISLQNNINEIISPMGAKSKVVLPDGTEVWLNAGSKLRYSQSYNSDNRDVFLEGEAFFKVKTNPKKPFIVKASDMRVKAYGTAFNVKAYPEEGTITTTLVEGFVKIEGYNDALKKFEISLNPNQKLTYFKDDPHFSISQTQETKTASKEKNKELSIIKNAIPVTLDNNINTSLYTSWKDDRWILERETLDNLAIMLGRRYDVMFICESEILKKVKFSGTIRKETLEQVLDILKLTAPLYYDIKEGIVTLYLDKSRSDTYSKVIN